MPAAGVLYLEPALAAEPGPDESALTGYELHLLETGSDAKYAAAERERAAAEQVQALRAELGSVRADAAEHAARLDEEIARLADERDLRDRALAEANAALDHVHGSRSWRVTAPLRAGRRSPGPPRSASAAAETRPTETTPACLIA